MSNLISKTLYLKSIFVQTTIIIIIITKKKEEEYFHLHELEFL
jgi:hypothetical protein